MVKTKKFYTEITMLKDELDDEKLFNILKANIPNSFIRIYSVNKVTRSDIK